ncbi:NupC/NupG family nucleoside CNT transporter [Echinimonas agarilytica]|uniref:Nucleoside permease n=1 Tax=Echinimonas agarilytica TaxID=1215918 RepID=A0AA42B767_9GAMM|nr:NupC/NupG family nucleoside CNT transporter [Echinimonas agarilytica]MCM2679554.1 NupC/NupG family nucleoside CNT transporter [Echinimonas agarilytica]
MSVMMSLIGIVSLLAVGYLLSDNRSAVRWRTVGGAFLIQASIAALVIYVPFGQQILLSITNAVQSVIDSAQVGISFLFGGLGTDAMFANGVGFVFAVRVLPIIVFFSSLIAVLYYLGVMQWVIRVIGGALQKLLNISRPESMSATANIFVGQTEAPLVVRPFIPTMTQSELFAIMVGGLASVAGSVLAGYAGMGVELKYLIAACFMAAPGGLMMAKLMKPEVDAPRQDIQELENEAQEDAPANVLDAAAQGASSGLKLALNVGAMLLAFIALIALLNSMVGGVASWFGQDGVSIELLLGYVFSPLAFLIGVPWSEALQAGSYIGQKLVLNEFIAYADFVENRDALSIHSQLIVTFALCGFANLSSIAILLGGIGGMAPNRRSDIARMGIKAVVAASMANFMSAALAGLFFSLS